MTGVESTAERTADVVLRDGSTVRVRPLRPDDRPAIERFLAGVSRESLNFRFFAATSVERATDWCTDVGHNDRYSIVVETGTPRRIVAQAGYVRVDLETAEVAFLVDDAWQSRGIATILLAHLAEAAGETGITTFAADVLPANYRMIEVFRESGFPVRLQPMPGVIKVEFPVAISPEAASRFDERERIAAVAAVRGALAPNSVAVIGASRRRGTVGGELIHNILEAGFAGPVYAVNAHGGQVEGLHAYRSVLDLPEAPELAVVVVPADSVVAVARDCAAKRVRAMVVISAGFAELGGEGADRQRELLSVCRDAGIRLIGPNCLGVLNTAASVSLDATFAPHRARPGHVALMSQSGGLGIAIIEAAARLGIGLSSFASVGNKTDLSGNDFLQYWEQDPDTKVALLYLESFGNPRKFARVARRVSRTKPIVAVKSGRSVAGARGATSHTGALLQASDVNVDALFRQTGVIRTDTLTEMFNTAAMLSTQPVPAGDRIAIVTNGGGPGIVCADACQAAGVQVPELPPELAQRLAARLPATASVANPIDMIATATAEDYGYTISTLAASGAVDAILAIFVPPLVTGATDVAVAIREAARSTDRCAVAAVFMTAEGPPPELGISTRAVPGFQFPEEAARAVAHAARYGRWRAREEGTPMTSAPSDVVHGAAIISRELSSGAEWMSPQAVAELLACHGIPQAATQIVAPDPDAAAAAAAELGLPVALKAIAPGLLHKRDAGAVAVGLATPEAVERAAETMLTKVSDAGFATTGLLVQEMVGEGVELLVGVVHDPSFGPVVACGAGGTLTELLGDVSVRLTPVTDLDAFEMVRELRVFRLLSGFRGSAPCDIASVEQTLLRVSAMVGAHPEIRELDCNPLIARPDGAVVVDARIRIAPAPPEHPLPSVD